MDSFKEKSQVFVLGMLVGLVVAGSFFILKLDDYFKELNVYKNLVKTFYLRSKSQETDVKNDESISKDAAADKKSKQRHSESSENKVNSNTISYTDSLNIYGYEDTATVQNKFEEEVVVVRKDEILASKLLEVVSLNQQTNATADSLLQKVSGVRDDRNATKQNFTIELWQSPLNYKGYKMSKSKIVIYGIQDIEGIKVYKLNDDVYLKNAANVYKLEYSDEFGAYQMVNDAAIVSKLK